MFELFDEAVPLLELEPEFEFADVELFELDELEDAVDELELDVDESSLSSASEPTLETTSTSSSVEMASFGETTARRDVSPCCASTFTTVPMISPRA